MILNINSPAYYTQKFGVDSELYALSRKISKSVQNKKYSDVIDTIGIVPIIAPKELLEDGLFKEKVHVSKSYKFADVELQINYDEFINSNDETKKKLYITNIIDSIKVLEKRLKRDFHGEEMINDILRNIEQ